MKDLFLITIHIFYLPECSLFLGNNNWWRRMYKLNADKGCSLFISGDLEDYWRRKKLLQTPTEIVEVLKVLIYHNEVQDPHVYDGHTRQMVSNYFKSIIILHNECLTQWISRINWCTMLRNYYMVWDYFIDQSWRGV